MISVEFKNVTKKFIDKKETIEALKETSFKINAGEFVAIIGPSGSGKSTLLTLMGGLQKPTSGNIFIDSEPFGDASELVRSKQRLNKIGFILQQSNLVPYLTIKEQFQLVDKVKKQKANINRINSLMEKLNISKLANSYPQDLSGGERQRAAIARAIYSKPSLVLADEPTASLDSKKAFEVVKILANETKEEKRVTVMVTHDERLLDYCDRIFEITDGILTERKKTL